ncbi:hypothetical protein OSB04_007443 [Centaurea solstitialis]|uniref:Reverse transcriptase n=1 Tax=Centaurea solstitialis TaxID=347529 RepID=A0AA38U4F6_9ASTR|nr:hypothetical protein OSB04_007443 [Centaurea solstitialis]
MRAHKIIEAVQREQRVQYGVKNPKTLIAITPTYVRTFQALHLIGLMHTLMNLPYDVVWIVVEAGGATNETATLLAKSKLRIKHIGFEKKMRICWGARHKMESEMRLRGLRVVREEKLDGIVMFADDSNMHSLELFDEIQKVEWIGAVSVGILAHSARSDDDPFEVQKTMDEKDDKKSESPLPVQGPACNSSDQLIGWHTFNSGVYKGKSANYIGDMAVVLLRKLEWSGFVMNSRLVWKEAEFRPDWIKDLDMVVAGDGDDDIESPLSLLKDSSMVEPLGSCGKKVMLWWLRAEARADSKFPSGYKFDYRKVDQSSDKPPIRFTYTRRGKVGEGLFCFVIHAERELLGENRPLESRVVVIGGNNFAIENNQLSQFISNLVSERDRSEMTKNANTRIDDLESNMVSMKESLQKMMQEISKISRQQDEVNSRLNSVHSVNDDEASGSGGMRNRSEGSDDHNRFLAVKGRKLEIPTFDGTDPDGWILRAERYFSLNRLSQAEKIDVSFIAFEGAALKWFQWENRRHPISRWEDLRALILRQFRSTVTGTLCEQFLAVKQEGSVEEFQRKFVELAAPLEGIPEEVFMSQFINGLEGLIKAEVRMLNPATLEEAMELAMKIEAKNAVLAKERSIVGGRKTGLSFSTSKNATEPSMSVNSPNALASSVNRTGSGFRRLTDQEVQQKRTLGLCYRCDEKYSPGHRCKKRELSVLLVQSEETREEEERSEGETALDTAAVYEVDKEVEVHLNSVVGITNPKTMKMEGLVGDLRVVILIDSGATHNFISTEIVERKKIKVEKTKEYMIKLGLGERVKGNGLCKQVEVNVQGLIVMEDFLPIQLGNSDVILGMQWLETLGNTWVNWKEQIMKFTVGGRTVTLRGDPSLGRSLVSLKAMSKLIQQEGQAILIELGSSEAMPEENLESEVPTMVQTVLDEYGQIFNWPEELPPRREKEHAITLKEGTEAVNVRPYRYPHYQKNEIEKLVKEMLEAKIIRASNSPFSSPVLLVKKKDGSWRFCIDYRALNKATVVDKFPIPVIDELLDELYGAKVFSKLDLKSGYHQIRMREEDIHKTAFRTHQGHYEFMVMPFGLVNAPSTFQGLMNEVFKEYLRKFVLVFFDDILIYSHSMEDHVEHMRKVFCVLAQNQLYANKKKCEFAKERLGYLGHVISQEGVEVDESKIKAIREWPAPKNVTELRGFLGLSGYYRKFIKGYGIIASPLTDLLRKNQFEWTVEAQTTFNRLKVALSTAPVLKLPDFATEFVIETDASGVGVGAVLMQNEQPVAYFSQVLGIRARQKSAYEKELMAIVLAVKKWRPYLLGNHFTVRSDQQSLKFLLEQRVVEPEYQNWMSKLMGYNFSIVYKQGSANRAADALSRKPEQVELANLSAPNWIHWEEFKKDVEKDEFLMRIRSDLLKDNEAHKGFEVRQDLLFYKDRLVVPRKSPWIQQLFTEFHATPIGGHNGEVRTFQRMSAELFWVGMRKDITNMVRECEVCQRNKVLSGSPAGLLQPLALPNTVWSDVTMDFIEGLPKSSGWNTIMVVVDRMSKYAHFVPLKHPFNAQTVAAAFVKEIVRLHGIPATIVSDRDKVFQSLFWKELFKLQGTTLKFSSAYHPQTDGQTEVVNRGLEQYLRCWVSDRPRQWSQWLAWAELSYNTAYHSAIKGSPFRVLYGRDPPPLVRYRRETAVVHAVETELETRDEIWDETRMHLLKAQFRMKQQADLKRTEVHFDVGDWVFLKIRPYRQKSLVKGTHPKLLARFYGPYIILEKIGEVAYRLQLPKEARIHSVFHVSQLRRAVGNSLTSRDIPTQLTEDLVFQVEPEALLDVRKGSKHDPGDLDVLVKWKGTSEFESTWENLTALTQQFPNDHLEDKVKVLKGGIDKPPIRFTYTRRGKWTIDPPLEVTIPAKRTPWPDAPLELPSNAQKTTTVTQQDNVTEKRATRTRTPRSKRTSRGKRKRESRNADARRNPGERIEK